MIKIFRTKRTGEVEISIQLSH